MNEPFNPQEEVEKLCEEHKIFFTGKGNVTHENLISVGLGNLLYNQLSQFVDKKENNGFYILEIKNPETKQKYNIEIKYEGGEEPNVPEKNENKKKEKKFLNILGDLTGWKFLRENWNFENLLIYKFKKGNIKPSNQRFNELIEKNPLSWAMTSTLAIEYTLEEPEKLL